MSFEQRDMSGALFRNEKREAEQQPEYTGSITINGTQFLLSAWVKSSKSGKKFFSLAAREKQERPASLPVRQEENPLDDPLPF